MTVVTHLKRYGQFESHTYTHTQTEKKNFSYEYCGGVSKGM